MLNNAGMLDVRLGDVPLELVLAGLVGSLIGAVMIGIVTIKKKVQADDDLPEQEIVGRVLEKTTGQEGVAGIMTFAVEWVIVEDESGNRGKYRNTRTNQIFINTGDYCRMTVRGNTIYEYTREKN